MIQGEVTPYREALIPVRISGATGEEVDIEAVVDTGFTDYLTLPPELIAQLELPFRDSSEAMLADGSIVIFDIHRATVLWQGVERSIPVQSAKGDSLIGMSLLYGCVLTVEVVDGGIVAIKQWKP